MRYVAFLRGINVGGNVLVKMTDLARSFGSLGFSNVIPVLASGNVVFEAPKQKPDRLKKQIENMLTKGYGVQTVAIIRTGEQILALARSNPFTSLKPSTETKLQVTFLAEATGKLAKLPRPIPAQQFQVIQVSPGEVCSAIDLSTNARTPELMNLLEKQFGKNITTRTWNTLEKIAKLIS